MVEAGWIISTGEFNFDRGVQESLNNLCAEDRSHHQLVDFDLPDFNQDFRGILLEHSWRQQHSGVTPWRHLNLYDRMANVTLKKNVSHKRESCITNFFLAFSTPPHGLFDLLTPPHTSSHLLTPPHTPSSLLTTPHYLLITSSSPLRLHLTLYYEFRNNWKESCWRVPG